MIILKVAHFFAFLGLNLLLKACAANLSSSLQSQLKQPSSFCTVTAVDGALHDQNHCSGNVHKIRQGKIDVDEMQETEATIFNKEVYFKMNLKNMRGGGIDTVLVKNQKRSQSIKRLIGKRILASWSIIQVLCILTNAIRRLLPIAIQPFLQNDLEPFQWGLYISWALYMAYMEGYESFQKKFSPLIVKRAFKMSDQSLTPLNIIFAGPYAMGMFGATRKRMIISWSVTGLVFGLVKIVKKLPYPYRSIVDAGVIVGLTYGSTSILLITIRAFFGLLPKCDPCFVE